MPGQGDGLTRSHHGCRVRREIVSSDRLNVNGLGDLYGSSLGQVGRSDLGEAASTWSEVVPRVLGRFPELIYTM